MTDEEVAAIYANELRTTIYHPVAASKEEVMDLCESHEALRQENARLTEALAKAESRTRLTPEEYAAWRRRVDSFHPDFCGGFSNADLREENARLSALLDNAYLMAQNAHQGEREHREECARLSALVTALKAERTEESE